MNASNDLPVTSMLAYCCVHDDALPRVRSKGLRADADGHRIYRRFQAARDACPSRLLVIDVYEVESSGHELQDRVPAHAIVNLDPFRQPVPVAAGGGFITRQTATGIEVLLIHRRGVWDLPKGKQDPGESVAECARREVQEELGIADVGIEGNLGQTVHGYADDAAYAVKTTHWFRMSTTARSFMPEEAEGIDAAEWFAWHDARAALGYETLRRHMDRLEPFIRDDG
ncbi:MAG: NUDIX hydrolase [Rhodothermales bacterium]